MQWVVDIQTDGSNDRFTNRAGMGVSFKQNPMGFKTFCKRFTNKQSKHTAELFAIINASEIACEINLPVLIHRDIQ